jgi:hypothetical protein
VLEFAHLKLEEVRHEPLNLESQGLLDALELAPSAINQLAIGWTFARGEFEGLRVERPVRMAAQGASVWA